MGRVLKVHSFRGRPSPARFNMAGYCIGRAARTTPGKIALVVLDAPGEAPCETWTYAELEDAVQRIAAALQGCGLASGSRILIRLDNTSAYALLFFGAIAAGLVPVPASVELTGREVNFLLTDCGASAVALADT